MSLINIKVVHAIIDACNNSTLVNVKLLNGKVFPNCKISETNIGIGLNISPGTATLELNGGGNIVVNISDIDMVY